MKNKVNVSVQVVPVNVTDSYPIIDKCIELVQDKKLKHEVSPFSTSLEGDLETLWQTILEMKAIAHEEGAEELLLNIQIHSKKDSDVTFESKIEKYSKL